MAKNGSKKKISGERIYWKLQEGWTDIIAERICQQHKVIDCVFSFKNNIVTPRATAQYYAKFIGSCIECNASITGILLTPPKNDVDVIFSCKIENIKASMHVGCKKRQLRGQRREKIAIKMIEQRKDAVTFRREEARRLKKFGGKNIPILPNTTVLRKAKEQQLLKMHGLEFANPLINLLHQSECGKYAGSIHSIGLLKIHCMYWTPEQQQMYVTRCKKDSNAILTIDATGSIVKRDKQQDSHVFLYQCMLVTQEGSVPVFQMVSADQRSYQIANFLRFILTKGVPYPPIVTCDFGRAILNAVAEIFGRCSDLPAYLQKCYNVVVSSISNDLPATYIRLDVSHLIAMVSRWKCLKTKVLAARRLYLRCIAQAYQMSDFKTLAYFLESVLAVALSEYLGTTKNDIVVPAQIRMEVLDRTIEGVAFTDLNADDNEAIQDKDNASDNDILEDDTSDWKTWTNTIYATAQDIGNKSKEGTIINACFNPDFALRLKKQLIPYLPLWTGIMRLHFGIGSTIATSSSVESEFNDLKNRAFKNQLPMRIDKFVFQHLDHLESKLILASHESNLSFNDDIT